jgi:L-alanine-DL-glutamate epimerase-like enolase superfamily enzyme
MGVTGSQIGYLKPLLVGADVFEVEPLMRKLRYAAYVGPKPWALEIALWDAIGKLCGQPLFRLLGGSQSRVKAYASMLRLIPAEEQVQQAMHYFEQGFRAIKLRAHRLRVEEDLEVIQAVRLAVGSDMEIMVDANQAWSTDPPFWNARSALRFARELEKLDVAWLEEPLPKDDVSGLAELCRKSEIPIAGGELEWGIHRFQYLLEKQAIDIVQPDPHWCGGILECRKISALAEAQNKLCILHSGGIGGLTFAANLQLSGALPNCPYFEYMTDLRVFRPEVRDVLLQRPILVSEDGYIDVPTKPGIGVDLDEEAIARYREDSLCT